MPAGKKKRKSQASPANKRSACRFYALINIWLWPIILFGLLYDVFPPVFPVFSVSIYKITFASQFLSSQNMSLYERPESALHFYKQVILLWWWFQVDLRRPPVRISAVWTHSSPGKIPSPAVRSAPGWTLSGTGEFDPLSRTESPDPG